MAKEYSNLETKTAQAMTPDLHAKPVLYQKGRFCIFFRGNDPESIQHGIVNAPQKGAELYDYGTEQS